MEVLDVAREENRGDGLQMDKLDRRWASIIFTKETGSCHNSRSYGRLFESITGMSAKVSVSPSIIPQVPRKTHRRQACPGGNFN